MENLTKEELEIKLKELKTLKSIQWQRSLNDGFWCMSCLLFLTNTFVVDYLSLEIFIRYLMCCPIILLSSSFSAAYIIQKKACKNIDLNINELKERSNSTYAKKLEIKHK